MIKEFNNLYNDSIVLNLNFDLPLVSISPTDTSNLNIFSNIYLNEAVELTRLKNDVDELVKIFPSMEDDIEILDL
jgi:hypothetical protein